MKIAIVGPSPVPFGIGGMEYLLWGMQQHMNEDTAHKSELIKLPTKETNFWELVNSYKQFYDLDLSHFDMVITTKYPAWMVQHPNHICYMAHRLRGLYDTYHFMNLPGEPNRNHPLINSVLDYIDKKDSTIEGMFNLLEQCYEKRDSIPKEHVSFPSPFARKVIHFLDNKALSNTRQFYAISKTVKGRKEYFPENVEIEVIYPPSALPQLKNQGYGDYIFTISRLDGAKRIALMIEAMKHVKGDIKLKIAGTGPEEQALKELAKGDPRIEFLGFVNDNDAIEYYAKAKGVIYIPYEEDYGLVTIEAMMSHKPVITCYDSGGTTEFVEQGRTGFISQSEPTAIAKSIESLNHMDESELIQMGENCFNKVKNITWENVVTGLTGEQSCNKQRVVNQRNKKKLTVTTTFPIYPPQGGGQARVYNLYKAMAKDYNIEIVSFTNVGEPKFKGVIADGLVETRIPKSNKHQEEESHFEREIGIPITDVVMPFVSQYTPEYSKALKESINDSEMVIVCHPFLLHEVKKHIGNKPFIYEAQDVEYLIKKEMLGDSKKAKLLIEEVYKLEKECCEKSMLIMTCSEEDKEKLAELYSVPLEKIVVVPNGVDVSATKYTSLKQRLFNKQKRGIRGQKVGMFMGSWHPPNLEACEHIFEIAKKCPDVIFLLLGSQCLYFKDRNIPSNVGLMGVVSEEVKNEVFGAVDFALNPMLSGSGTNLKMFDYMAAGIPIITTKFGTRGIESKEHFIVREVQDMPKYINEFNLEQCPVNVQDVRYYVEQEFDWNPIANIIMKKIE